MAQILFVEDGDSDIEGLQLELSMQDEDLTRNTNSNLQSDKINDITTNTVKIKEGSNNLTGDQNVNSNMTDKETNNETIPISQENKQEEEEEDIPLYPLIPIDKTIEELENKPDLSEIRLVDINLSLSLPFQYEMLQSCLNTDDHLMILGKGLGLSSVVANLLYILATPIKIENKLKNSLIIVMNATTNDNQRLSDELQELSWLDINSSSENDIEDKEYDNTALNERKYYVVTADALSVDKRRQLYLQGGIISVTSRILIVDLLSGILHPNKITGMVILNVDTLRDYSNESFIIEIYRTQNRWGFIKGFSECPESFIMEFSPLLRRMNELKFKRVLLWPRFRLEISSVLNKNSSSTNNNVIEVKVNMTQSMSQIQFGIMGCLKKCIDELNRKNPELSIEWWNIDNALDINFLKSIDTVMIPNWHRISYESKQLVKDIRFLKHLLKLLISNDCVDFYEEIQLSLDANKPSVTRKYSESPWLMAEESQLIISYARKRIFFDDKYCLEEAPKWEQLLSIIDDISHEKLLHSNSGPTLIVCHDKSTVRQLSKILKLSKSTNGFRYYLMRKLEIYKQLREERKKLVNEVKKKEIETSDRELNVSATFAKKEVSTNRRRTRGASAVAAVERLRNSGINSEIEHIIQEADFTQELADHNLTDEEGDENIIYLSDHEEDEQNENLSRIDETEQQLDHVLDEEVYEQLKEESWKKRQEQFGFIDSSDQIVIERFCNITDEYFLQELRCSHIILYEPDLAFIRRVEIYRATYDGILPKVFFMYYGESVEEQSHLTAIKREKDAFTKLIKENANLAHHYETAEDLFHFKNLAERKIKLARLNKRNTRNAGGQKGFQTYTQDIVIVDTREFNASLPGLLFRYGIRVVPCMLSVGDYVITPDICIERKSVSDLIGSLQNNRLVTQCRKMVQFYKYPTLLIEFDQSQSFSLEPFSERRTYKRQTNSSAHPISNKLSQYEIQLKLTKIVTRFPTLKIIWSSSPLQSVNIILELKMGREQPEPIVATSYGTNLRKNAVSKVNKSNTKTEFFIDLLKIPGLSKIDYFNIRKSVKTYSKLQHMTVQQITDIIGDVNLANKVFEYVAKQKEEIEEDD